MVFHLGDFHQHRHSGRYNIVNITLYHILITMSDIIHCKWQFVMAYIAYNKHSPDMQFLQIEIWLMFSDRRLTYHLKTLIDWQSYLKMIRYKIIDLGWYPHETFTCTRIACQFSVGRKKNHLISKVPNHHLGSLLAVLVLINLTHLPLDKMAAILQTIFQMHFCEWKVFCFD